MARPLRIAFAGAFYHVTSRGNERKAVFKSIGDRQKLLEYLETATVRYNAVIHAYCLMSNHYHLLLETPSGNLPQIMRHINGAYTTYFNVKRGRAGHLFQGRYKAIVVQMDPYAKELSRYIHLNPVRANLAETPDKYEWSSYRKPVRDLPAIRKLGSRITYSEIFDQVESEFGQDPAAARNIKLYLCRKHTGEKLRTIDAQFGIGDGAVSQAYKRFKLKLEKDSKLKKEIERFEKKFILSNIET